MKTLVIILAVTTFVSGSYADTFGTGANQFTVDFVNIGNARNTADTTGYGAVDYNYRMGKLEVTIDQFTKARAADSRIGNGNEDYYNWSGRGVGTGAPAVYVSWYEAATFANWLTTGDAYSGVYQFDNSGELIGIDRTYRNGINMAYVLPNEDEWYKAAYYRPVNDGSYSLYASGLNTVPTHGTTNGWNYYNNGYAVGYIPGSSTPILWETGFGSQEQNGTFDMNGNVMEWIEAAADGTLDDMDEDRVLRGGSMESNEYNLRSTTRYINQPTYGLGGYQLGFRVAAIPEPSSIMLMGFAGGGVLFIRRLFPAV